jgi:folate-dependent tRNA-U54 methylase TrmFO/GidA
MKCPSNKLQVEKLSEAHHANNENELRCSKQMRGDSQIWSVKSKLFHTVVPCLAAFLRYVVLMIDFYSGSLD